MLSLIGQPARIQILLIIGAQEACVCHLEAVLGMRQAGISQHLMALRKAGLVTAQRDGRNIFYHLTHPEVVERSAAGRAAHRNRSSGAALADRPAHPKLPLPAVQSGYGPQPDLREAALWGEKGKGGLIN